MPGPDVSYVPVAKRCAPTVADLQAGRVEDEADVVAEVNGRQDRTDHPCGHAVEADGSATVTEVSA